MLGIGLKHFVIKTSLYELSHLNLAIILWRGLFSIPLHTEERKAYRSKLSKCCEPRQWYPECSLLLFTTCLNPSSKKRCRTFMSQCTLLDTLCYLKRFPSFPPIESLEGVPGAVRADNKTRFLYSYCSHFGEHSTVSRLLWSRAS